MKNIIHKNSLKIASLLLVVFTLGACSEWLNNPLKDKETGDDINLLLLDFNFFTTRMTYKLIDATDNVVITSPATIRFSGANGNDIVNFAGIKKQMHTTSEGQFELTIDPNIVISESTPFEFAVHVEIDGYTSITKGYQFRSEGAKTLELELSKIENEEDSDLEGDINISDGDTSIIFFVPRYQELKSAQVVDIPYEVNYKISLGDLAKFKDSNNQLLFENNDEAYAFVTNELNSILLSTKTFRGYLPEVDLLNHEGDVNSVLFHKLETGRLDKIQLISPELTRTVGDLNGGVIKSIATYLNSPVPDVFGFGIFSDSWMVNGTETVYDNLNFKYTLVKASLEPLCETGSSITFSSNVQSSFSITGDVYDAETNEMLTFINFKGDFPQTFVVENTPQRAVRIVFRNENTSFQDIPDLEIDNFCSGSDDVFVVANDGYQQYQIVLIALCPSNPTVGIAPTYSAEIKIKNSNDPWQGIEMTGGVMDLLGIPNTEYSLRLLWEGAWEYSSFYTEFDANGNYIHDYGDKTNITSKRLDDGRMQITVEQVFNQDVCNDMGW